LFITGFAASLLASAWTSYHAPCLVLRTASENYMCNDALYYIVQCRGGRFSCSSRSGTVRNAETFGMLLRLGLTYCARRVLFMHVRIGKEYTPSTLNHILMSDDRTID